MQKKHLLILLVLYVISTGISYAGFSYASKKQLISLNLQPSSGQTAEEQAAAEEESALAKLLTIAPNEPREEVCPLNGKKFTKQEREAWEKRRPLAVMIENHPDARPQSGMSSADVVFEAIAEGGVTRFMGMFYCAVQAEDTPLAPVRSARSYFIDWASSYNFPLYVHVGGANLPGPADALGQLSEYGWTGQNDINQFSVGYPTFVRDYNRVEGKDLDTEHTMVTSTEKLWQVAEKRKWTNMSPDQRFGKKVVPGTDWKTKFSTWSFQDGKAGGAQNPISFEFWDGFAQYAVRWEYDPSTNLYKRFMANEADVDLNNDKQVMAANAIVLFTDEKGPIDEKKHMLYKTVGTGDALVFQNGKAIQAKWSKKDRQAPLLFTDDKGKALEMVRGLTWISVVANKTDVSY